MFKFLRSFKKINNKMVSDIVFIISSVCIAISCILVLSIGIQAKGVSSTGTNFTAGFWISSISGAGVIGSYSLSAAGIMTIVLFVIGFLLYAIDYLINEHKSSFKWPDRLMCASIIFVMIGFIIPMALKPTGVWDFNGIWDNNEGVAITPSLNSKGHATIAMSVIGLCGVIASNVWFIIDMQKKQK